jgi:probable phosphoglycerate mutase
MREVFVFRHGQTDWNAEGRIQGHLDVPLNDVGRAQARRLIEPLRRLGAQAMLSSDLGRARESAEIVARELGIAVFTDEGLREIYLGKLQGLTREEIEVKFGVEFSNQVRHSPLTDADVARLGSESGEQVHERATAAVQRFCEAHGFERFGVATHGGVLRRILQYAENHDGTFPAPIANSVLYPLGYDPTRRAWAARDRTAR